FQDSDDEWRSEKLERQIRLLEEHKDVAAVYSDMHRIHSDGRVSYYRSPTLVRGRLINPETRFWQTYMLAMQPVLIRHLCLEELTFDERLMMLEDMDFTLLLSQRYEFLHLKEPLVNYYETFGMTADYGAELKSRRRLLRKYARTLLASDPT